MMDRLWMQSHLAAERGLYLGAPAERLRVVGNVKFDQELPAPRPEAVKALQTAFGSDDRPLWIAGSTHPGEEEQVLAAFKRLRAKLPELSLLLAPRHIERAAEVTALAEVDGWSVARRSRVSGPVDVLVLDTMGELSALYGFADVVFVGGSLIPIGGHDILQPLFYGKPTLFGPHMHNQRDIAALALEAEAALKVSDTQELTRAVEKILAQPELREALEENARHLLAENTGAAEECAALLYSLGRGEEPPPGSSASRSGAPGPPPVRIHG
jgi:3-deoxy-D-manno-octulosonic-acid transferase